MEIFLGAVALLIYVTARAYRQWTEPYDWEDDDE